MKPWLQLAILGVLSVAFGIFTLGAPVLASFAVTTLLGALLLLIGILQVAGSITASDSAGSKILGTILGVIMAFLGISFLANPLQGMISLAMLVLILLAASGIIRLIYAFGMKQTEYFWPMLISGAVSLALAGYILANFAAVSPALLGILLGIELVFNGIGLIILAFFTRRMKPEDSSS